MRQTPPSEPSPQGKGEIGSLPRFSGIVVGAVACIIIGLAFVLAERDRPQVAPLAERNTDRALEISLAASSEPEPNVVLLDQITRPALSFNAYAELIPAMNAATAIQVAQISDQCDMDERLVGVFIGLWGTSALYGDWERVCSGLGSSQSIERPLGNLRDIYLQIRAPDWDGFEVNQVVQAALANSQRAGLAADVLDLAAVQMVARQALISANTDQSNWIVAPCGIPRVQFLEAIAVSRLDANFTSDLGDCGMMHSEEFTRYVGAYLDELSRWEAIAFIRSVNPDLIPRL